MRASVVWLPAWAILACSSTGGSSGGSTGDGGAEDATTESGATGTEGGIETGLESSASSEPCDASIVLPTDGSTGTPCGQCIKAHCASALATCQLDCLCVSSIECLAVHNDNYTLCADALSAIGAGNPGLTAVAGCIAMSCVSVCNATD
jgi:hypothetical protein